MSLANFDLGDGAAGNITSGQLQFGCQRFLCHMRLFAQRADISANAFFYSNIHPITVLHLFQNNLLDIIIFACYTLFAPI